MSSYSKSLFLRQTPWKSLVMCIKIFQPINPSKLFSHTRPKPRLKLSFFRLIIPARRKNNRKLNSQIHHPFNHKKLFNHNRPETKLKLRSFQLIILANCRDSRKLNPQLYLTANKIRNKYNADLSRYRNNTQVIV